MATSRTLQNLRNRFRRTAEKLRKTAERLGGRDSGIANSMKREAAGLERLAEQSLVGRRGTKKERAEKIKRAQEALEINKSRLTTARQQTTKKGVKEQQARRERQETIFTKQMQIRQNTGAGAYNNLFWSETRQYWAGAETPEDRYAMIVEATGASNISEARDIIMSKYTENQQEINVLMSRDWKTLKQMGWTDDEINEAKRYDAKGQLYKYIENRYNR